VTGVDEHGQKIERAAAQARVSPEHHCNTISASFQDLWDRLDIRYNSFVRTSSSRHAAIVKDIFKRLWDNGDIYLGKQRGWYCVGCEEFKTEKDLLDNNHCPLHPNTQVEWRDEENYFFRLSKYQDALETIYSENPELIQPLSRREEVLNFIRGGLKDFSISRLNTPWGIPVPKTKITRFMSGLMLCWGISPGCSAMKKSNTGLTAIWWGRIFYVSMPCTGSRSFLRQISLFPSALSPTDS
jgi:methionyl-tRNA synthetase